MVVPENLSELTALFTKLAHSELDLKAMGTRSAEIVSNYTPERAAEAVVDTIRTATA